MNKIHVIHMLTRFIYIKFFELGLLVYGISTVLEDTNGCTNQYGCVFGYLINDCVIIFIWDHNVSVNKGTWS